MNPIKLNAVVASHGKWMRDEPGGVQANLADADLTGADLTGADLTGADLTGADLTGADLTGADLTGAKLQGAILTGAILTGAVGFRFADAPDPRQLRLAVAAHIEAHPELHDQSFWGEEECNTPCCVAGWACRLGGGARGQRVGLAATCLLWLDGAPMPRFDPDVSRAEILAALRAEPTS